MARGLLARLRELVEGNTAVTKVANDPAAMAELLLLFRMILADGKAQEREMAVLRRICSDALGIAGDDLEQVLQYVQDFGYETTSAQAIAVFREMPRERRIMLARHMADISKADAELNHHEVRLLARVVDMLQISPQDVVDGQPLN